MVRAVVLLKPASPGIGVIAGGGVRAVIEAAGVRDVLTKSLGASNKINVVRATLLALENLRYPKEVVARRKAGIEVNAEVRKVPKLKITWVKSDIGYPKAQKRTLKALGLSRLNQVVEHEDTASIQGMLVKVRHLIKFEVV